MDNTKPLLLLILDGWGHSDKSHNNAMLQAKLPTWDQLWHNCPHTLLSASGLDVGLPQGQMGNSEVGHMTIGAGRVIFQDLTRINQAIENGSFNSNPALLNAIKTAKQKNSALHILGLLSSGGIHSHEEHICAFIELAKKNNITKIYLHAFLDGRDTPPQSAAVSIKKFEPYIASIMGRFYAMDRDHRLERTQAAIDLLIKGSAPFHAETATTGLEIAYARGETDEFVQPTQIKNVTIQPEDVVVCMNFRTDRARQLCHALLKAIPKLVDAFVTLTEYDSKLPVQVAFTPQTTTNTLSETLRDHNLTQLHIAETEKYAHVTFFFNAGREEAVTGEDRIMIASPKVNTYDQQPAMSAAAITNALLPLIENKKYAVIICNFANADMVGHTGSLPAAITAVETIDHCLGILIAAIKKFGGAILITADHGNAEMMWDEQAQQPHTAHTTNLVPFIYVGPKAISFKTDKTYGLQDIAPTILELLEITKPSEMSGISLIE